MANLLSGSHPVACRYSESIEKGQTEDSIQKLNLKIFLIDVPTEY